MSPAEIRKTDDESEDDDDSEDDDASEPRPVIVEFRWRTQAAREGYFLVQYLGAEPEKMGVKEYLYDYAPIGLEWIWKRFGHDEDTVKFVDRAANGYLTINGTRRKVVPGFTTFKAYARKKIGILMSDIWIP